METLLKQQVAALEQLVAAQKLIIETLSKTTGTASLISPYSLPVTTQQQLTGSPLLQPLQFPYTVTCTSNEAFI